MESARPQSFLMERYWPGVERADVAAADQRLCRAAGDLTRTGAPIRVVSSTWIPAEEVVLTVFEAGEEEDILQVSLHGKYPFDRVQRVEVFAAVNRRWSGDERRV